MLSNCNHTAERVIPRLVENLNKHGYVEMNKTLKVCITQNKVLWVCDVWCGHIVFIPFRLQTFCLSLSSNAI